MPLAVYSITVDELTYEMQQDARRLTLLVGGRLKMGLTLTALTLTR